MPERVRKRENLLSQKLSRISFSKLSVKLFCLDSIGSTQDYLLRLPRAKEGYLVVSKIQTEGRGRQGRKWISDEGGLYVSLRLEPAKHISGLITRMCADSILIALKEYNLPVCQVKEPNDVICNGKKIAGVLVDAIVQGEKTIALAGLGVNLNNGPAWNDEMRRFATSYWLETRRLIDLNDFLISLLSNLDREYEKLH